MSDSDYRSLEEVIADEHFPVADLALRRGRHIGRDDGSVYDYLVDALEHLEPLYRRFGSELIHRSDGYFYLLPSGDKLGRRQLSGGEMLVGQMLALMHLDPATLQHQGVVQREVLLQGLSGLLGAETLVKILNPRKRKKVSERVAGEIARDEVAKALRRLVDLGFVDVVDSERLRLRPALMRFAEPVRGLDDQASALERLIQSGDVALDDHEEDEEPDEQSAVDDDEGGE